MWCGGRRREAARGSSARRRSCGGPSSPLRVAQKDPCARERAKGRERGEGGYKGGAGGRKGCGERTAAWAMVDATVGRAWAGLGLGPGTHLAQP